MCFEKQSRTKVLILKKDLYVLKDTGMPRFNKDIFSSRHQDFIYKAGKLLRKGIRDKIRACFKDELNGEVYHTFNLAYVTRLKGSTLKPADIIQRYGLFRIPKGSKIYTNDSGIVKWEWPYSFYDLATFNIEYVGPLTEENKHLVFDQTSY